MVRFGDNAGEKGGHTSRRNDEQTITNGVRGETRNMPYSTKGERARRSQLVPIFDTKYTICMSRQCRTFDYQACLAGTKIVGGGVSDVSDDHKTRLSLQFK